jgi:hypothetical protein
VTVIVAELAARGGLLFVSQAGTGENAPACLRSDEGNGFNTKDRRQRRRNEGPVRWSTQLDSLRSVSVPLRCFVLKPLSPSAPEAEGAVLLE